jgi:cell division protein ZapA
VSVTNIPVTVRILDKDYQVACPEEEKDDLIASARYLDRKMREIRDSGRIIGTDRIAVMAALNISHELLQVSEGRQRLESSLTSRIRAIQERIDQALDRSRQLEL